MVKYPHCLRWLDCFYLRLGFIAWIGVVVSPCALSQESWQSHRSIRAAVEAFVLQGHDTDAGTEVIVGSIDKRLRLAECPSPLETFWPPAGRRTGNVSVGVACAGSTPWKIYVQARVAQYQPVAVLSRPVVSGEALSKKMLRFERADVTRLGKHYITDSTPLEGYRFKRSVSAGRKLQARMLEAPLFVRRGERVTIVSTMSGLRVHMAGEALADGSPGDIIRVRNASSSRIVQGEVVRKGLVKILN